MLNLKDLCQVKDLMATVVQLESSLRTETGLNLNQSFALCCLAKGPLSAGDLADELRIHGASLSRVIKTLDLKGLIFRDLSRGDGRRKVLSLTVAGQHMAVTLAGCEQRLFPATVEERELAATRSREPVQE
ncbi:MAG: MarR family transcriptional regulator [Spirochaetales bacterium]